MTCQLDMDGDTRVLISHMAPARKRQVKESLREIMEDPHTGKPLQEELAGLWSYRIGTLRIVYSIDLPKKKIRVVTIGPRKTIYQDLERHFSRR